MEQDSAILEGAISIQAAMQAGNRPIHELVLAHDKRDHDALMLERAARRAGIRVRREDTDAITAVVSGSSHGGMIAHVGARTFIPIDQLTLGAPRGQAPFVAMLDGIEDPFNFGQATRALYAAGCHGLVVRRRNWMSAAGTVARASAGASELMPTALMDGPEEAARYFRGLKLAVLATGDEKNARALYDADLTVPLFLLIGGERRGISRATLELVDGILRIPYARDFKHSLGAAGATGVLAFEVMRQRGPQAVH